MNYQTLISAWFAVIILWSLSAIDTQAQSTKEAIVLMQSVPTRVLIEADGTIAKVIKTEPNYMAGYDIRPNNPIVPTPEVATVETVTVAAPVYTNILSFGDGSATLSTATILELDKIATRLKASTEEVNFTIFNTREQAPNNKLSLNRLDACKKYLVLKGVSKDRISNDTQIVSNGDRAMTKLAFVVK